MRKKLFWFLINSLYFLTRLDEMCYGSFHVQYGFKNKVIITFLVLSHLFIFFFVDYFGLSLKVGTHEGTSPCD